VVAAICDYQFFSSNARHYHDIGLCVSQYRCHSRRCRLYKMSFFVLFDAHIFLCFEFIYKSDILDLLHCQSCPLVTDIAAGYDHIASAIGAAISAAEGVICFVI